VDRSIRIGRRDAALGVGAAVVVSIPALARAEGEPDPRSTDRATDPRSTDRAIDPLSPIGEHDGREAVDVAAAHALAPIGEHERAWLGALATGELFSVGARRFRIAAAHAVREGAVPLVIESIGERPHRFAVEVLRRDELDPQRPVASTARLALVIVNRGDGARSTGELEGLATRALAERLAARDAASNALALLTRRERHARHPMGIFHVPL
jgi:hypothetical protein